VEEKVIEKPKVIDKVTIEERYVRSGDNFIVLFDTSSSMGETYKDTGLKKVEVEKNSERAKRAAFRVGLERRFVLLHAV
jgi:hypothetical protein